MLFTTGASVLEVPFFCLKNKQNQLSLHSRAVDVKQATLFMSGGPSGSKVY